MEKVFRELIDLFNSIPATIFLDCGVLLKFVRGDSIFPSSDIDFGVLASERFVVLKHLNLFRRSGFAVNPLGGYRRYFEGIKLTKKIGDGTTVSCDIYFYYLSENSFVRPNSHKPLKNSMFSTLLFALFQKLQNISDLNTNNRGFTQKCILIQSSLLFHLYFSMVETCQFRFPRDLLETCKRVRLDATMTVVIPLHVRSYLEWRYGVEWRVKNRDYRFSDGFMLEFRDCNRFAGAFVESPICDPVDNNGDFRRKKKRGLGQLSSRRSSFHFSRAEVRRVRKRVKLNRRGGVETNDLRRS